MGSTPAMMEKAMASGISASATTIPASTSPRTLENHVFLSDCSIRISKAMHRTHTRRMASASIRIHILRIIWLCALGVRTGHTAERTASGTGGYEVLRGGVALRRRRLPVDRLEYSHADVPVAQG